MIPFIFRNKAKLSSTIPRSVKERAFLHRQPIRIQHLVVHPISLQLSVHASLRLFLATDHAPLTLGRFERSRLFTGTQPLVYSMVTHYITAAIFRAGMSVFLNLRSMCAFYLTLIFNCHSVVMNYKDLEYLLNSIYGIGSELVSKCDGLKLCPSLN